MNNFARLLDALGVHEVDLVIVGGIAATVHGSSRLTADIDLVYDRSPENLQRLVDALGPLHPCLRGAPAGLPFRFDEGTIRAGLNFRLMTDAGAVDLLGEMAGVGSYEALQGHAVDIALFGRSFRCVDLETLIRAKRAAGRPKDLEVISELEVIRDARA